MGKKVIKRVIVYDPSKRQLPPPTVEEFSKMLDAEFEVVKKEMITEYQGLKHE